MPQLYLASWEWKTGGAGEGCWDAPQAALCLGRLDLRPLPAQGEAGGTAQGYGLFVYPTPVTIPGALALGGNLDQALSSSDKDAVRGLLGITEPLEGTTLLDNLWSVLTLHADPAGQNRAKGLMPTAGGYLELRLGGAAPSGLLRARRLARTDAEWPGVLEGLREQYRRIRAAGLPYRKVLGAWVRKYGVADYRIFIPADLPDEGMLPPSTTIADDFNRADSTSLGADWTEDSGDWQVLSNQLDIVSAGGTGRSYLSHNTSLSSDDHYAQAKIYTANPNSSSNLAVAMRYGDTGNHYSANLQDTFTDQLVLYKRVGNTPTVITSMFENWTDGDTLKGQADGGTLKLYRNGVEKLSVTDTALTGQLKTGIWTDGTNANFRWDDFEAGDLGGAAPVTRSQAVIVM